MTDPSFGPDGMPFPPFWALPLIVVGLLLIFGLIGYTLIVVLLAVLQPWQTVVVAALVFAAAVFALWHLLYGRKGC